MVSVLELDWGTEERAYCVAAPGFNVCAFSVGVSYVFQENRDKSPNVEYNEVPMKIISHSL